MTVRFVSLKERKGKTFSEDGIQEQTKTNKNMINKELYSEYLDAINARGTFQKIVEGAVLAAGNFDVQRINNLFEKYLSREDLYDHLYKTTHVINLVEEDDLKALISFHKKYPTFTQVSHVSGDGKIKEIIEKIVFEYFSQV